jgi:D-alanyl-D-alanine carboxypeptidase
MTTTRTRTSHLARSGAVAILLVIAMTASAATASAHSGRGRPPERQSLQQQVDAIVAAGATSAVAVVDSDHRHLRATSGVALVGTHRPVPHHGRFRIGSETKAFLATVVLQLVAERRLTLADHVDDVLPGVLRHGRHISVRQLLDHTSGLPEVLRTLPSPRSAAYLKLRWRTWTTAQLVSRVSRQKLDFRPGRATEYSNTNYLVLGMIVERITGHSYAHEIRSRILRPLHLRHTWLPGTDPDIPGPHAHGYLALDRGEGPTLVDITRVNPSLLNAAGEMISTTHDLDRFFDALTRGRLLPPYLLRQMEEPAPGSEYGLGILVEQLPCGVTLYGKDGDAPGYSTVTFADPASDRVVSVSVAWGTGDFGDAVDALVEAQMCG